jgi:hypothetical protein
MLLRKALLVALVVAPFVYSPSQASAQSGLDQAAVATAKKAVEVGAAQNSHAPQDLPPGLADRETLPPGINWTRQLEASTTSSDDDGADDGTSGGSDPVCLAWETVWSGFTSTQVCVLWGTP